MCFSGVEWPKEGPRGTWAPWTKGAEQHGAARLTRPASPQLYLRELLRLTHLRFYQHLASLGEDGLQILFCHRWLLLCFKREFPEAEALRIWEACWAHYQVSRGRAPRGGVAETASQSAVTILYPALEDGGYQGDQAPPLGSPSSETPEPRQRHVSPSHLRFHVAGFRPTTHRPRN